MHNMKTNQTKQNKQNDNTQTKTNTHKQINNKHKNEQLIKQKINQT